MTSRETTGIAAGQTIAIGHAILGTYNAHLACFSFPVSYLHPPCHKRVMYDRALTPLGASGRTDMDRGIRPLNIALLTLLADGHNQWRRGVRGGVPGPRAVGRRRAWGVRIRACCCLPRPRSASRGEAFGGPDDRGR